MTAFLQVSPSDTVSDMVTPSNLGATPDPQFRFAIGN